MAEPFRNGRVHVVAAMCSTCVFRDGNIMDLPEGRLEALIETATRDESAIICHSTLDGDRAVCHGFFQKYSTMPLRLARVMGVVEFVPPQKLRL